MSFKTIIKKKQNRLLSKTWRTTLVEREIERNNFHATGNVHEARNFAHKVSEYKLPTFTVNEPTVIFEYKFL